MRPAALAPRQARAHHLSGLLPARLQARVQAAAGQRGVLLRAGHRHGLALPGRLPALLRCSGGGRCVLLHAHRLCDQAGAQHQGETAPHGQAPAPGLGGCPIWSLRKVECSKLQGQKSGVARVWWPSRALVAAAATCEKAAAAAAAGAAITEETEVNPSPRQPQCSLPNRRWPVAGCASGPGLLHGNTFLL